MDEFEDFGPVPVPEEPALWSLLLVIGVLLALMVGMLALHGYIIAWLFGWSFWRGFVAAVLLQGLLAGLKSAVGRG